jgi:hypothetical protein
MNPGTLLCLKSAYRGRGHPDDGIIGIVLEDSGRDYRVLFTDLSGGLTVERVKVGEMMTYYEEIL